MRLRTSVNWSVTIAPAVVDEYDDDVDELEWVTPTQARVSARLHLEDLADNLELDLSAEELEDVDTIGGYVAKVLGRVPIPGSAVTLHGWQITAERPVGRRHRIATFLLEKAAAEECPEGSAPQNGNHAACKRGDDAQKPGGLRRGDTATSKGRHSLRHVVRTVGPGENERR